MCFLFSLLLTGVFAATPFGLKIMNRLGFRSQLKCFSPFYLNGDVASGIKGSLAQGPIFPLTGTPLFSLSFNTFVSRMDTSLLRLQHTMNVEAHYSPYILCCLGYYFYTVLTALFSLFLCKLKVPDKTMGFSQKPSCLIF